MRLKGLIPDAVYRTEEVNLPGEQFARPAGTFAGEELMKVGFPLPKGAPKGGDFISHVWKLTAE